MTPTKDMIAMAQRVAGITETQIGCQVWATAYNAALAAIMEVSAQHLQMIADLPTGATEDVMQGHEDCYRLIEATFTEPPKIVCKPSAEGSI